MNKSVAKQLFLNGETSWPLKVVIETLISEKALLNPQDLFDMISIFRM